jgi:GDSL-like Lipase/Acylhydrolase.
MFRSRRTLGRVLVAVTLATSAAVPLAVANAPAAAAGSLHTCPTTCVSISDATIVEGDSGTRTLTFPVTLSQPATSSVTMKYRIQAVTAMGGTTAAPGVDFVDRKAALQTLTFARAASGFTPVVKLITVKVFGDTTVEANEIFRVTLSALAGPARLRRPLAVGAILDDDGGIGIRANVGDASVAEGDTGKTRSLVIPVVLSGPSTSAFTLNYVVSPGPATYSSKAVVGGDFGGKLSGSIVFAVGVSGKTVVQKTISLPVWADSAVEPDEAVTVTISASTLPAGVSLGRTIGTGTIVDDDAATTSVAVPNSMAVLGDSISRAYNACPTFGECLASVWSTGTDTGVDSHYTRLLAINPAIAGNNHNDAVSGRVMADLNGQAVIAVSQNVDYVTIEMGGNDGCKSTEAQMTAAAAYQAQFQQAMTTLTNGLPNARILVASVPDLMQLWAVAKDIPAARSVWSAAGICPSMTANPLSTAQADVDRRSRVRQRVIDYNTALATVCAQYANCKFDQNVIFNSAFSVSDISAIDYFHPSYAGQTGFAVLTYAAGWDW